MVLGDTLRIEVDLENKGDRESAEVVMVFAQDKVASITPSVDKLKAYKRVSVGAKATKTLRMSVSTNDLGFVGQNLEYVVEPGVFGLRVNDQKINFELKINQHTQ